MQGMRCQPICCQWGSATILGRPAGPIVNGNVSASGLLLSMGIGHFNVWHFFTITHALYKFYHPLLQKCPLQHPLPAQSCQTLCSPSPQHPLSLLTPPPATHTQFFLSLPPARLTPATITSRIDTFTFLHHIKEICTFSTRTHSPLFRTRSMAALLVLLSFFHWGWKLRWKRLLEK